MLNLRNFTIILIGIMLCFLCSVASYGQGDRPGPPPPHKPEPTPPHHPRHEPVPPPPPGPRLKPVPPPPPVLLIEPAPPHHPPHPEPVPPRMHHARHRGCFIATAAYGTPWEKHVLTLKRFREEWLLTNVPGRWFVALYNKYSPPVADMIRERPWARAMTRLILTPVVIIAGAATGNIGDIALILLLGTVIAVICYVWKRRKAARLILKPKTLS